MPIYLKVPGITGSVKAKGYEGCVALNSCEFEVTREMQQGVGRGKNRSWTTPVVDKINCNKVVEDATGALFQWSIGAFPNQDAITLHFMKLGDEKWVEYMKWTLEKVILSSYTVNVDDSPEEKGTEDFQFSYLIIKMEFQEFNEDEKVGKPSRAGYDLAKGIRTG